MVWLGGVLLYGAVRVGLLAPASLFGLLLWHVWDVLVLLFVAPAIGESHLARESEGPGGFAFSLWFLSAWSLAITAVRML